MKVKELIYLGREKLINNNIEDASIQSRMLAEHVLNMDKVNITINSEKEVKKDLEDYYMICIDQIINGKPIQYITNKQEFMGIEFYVNENVLIPQPDTEILVEEVINICKEKNESINILDICTGSGAIGISLAKNLPKAKVTISDISNEALEVARRNVEKNDLLDRIEIIKSDMFENIKEKFDIIVSNPPYIETDVIKLLDLEVQNEPHLALDGGKDGLDFYRILVKDSHKYLKDCGYLCMEIGYNQKEKVEELLLGSEFENIYCKKDLSGNDRIVVGKLT